MALLRSMLFVPGDSERKIAKSFEIDADVVVYDLEDAVLPQRRPQARELVAKALAQPPQRAGQRRCVRINPMVSSDAHADLEAVIDGQPELIMLPKVRSVEDINRLSDDLDKLEAQRRLMGTAVIALVSETPEMLFGLGELRHASTRLVAITWGAEDLSAAVGASTNREANGDWVFTYQMVRSQCLLAAKACGLPAIETIFANFRDDDGLANACRLARRDGFDGMLAIHPAQVATINAGFSPSAGELADAEKVLAAFAAEPDAGAVQLDGRMLDMPHLKQAERIVALARELEDVQ